MLRESAELARKTFVAQLAGWRTVVDLSRLSLLRRRFDDAGIGIDIVAWDDLAAFSDDEVDYAFRVTKALGARALSTGISAGAPRGATAGKPQLFVGSHGHEAIGAVEFEAPSRGGFIGANRTSATGSPEATGRHCRS